MVNEKYTPITLTAIKLTMINYYTLLTAYLTMRTGRLRGPEKIFPDIVRDPDRNAQRLELGVSVSGFPGDSPLALSMFKNL
jgi:hypothetical protein